MTSMRRRRMRSGHVAYQVDYRDASGKRKHKQFEKKTAAEQFFADTVKAERQARPVLEDFDITVADYADRWLKRIEATVAQPTHANYAQMFRLYIAPVIGSMRMVDLDEATCGRLFTAWAEQGKSSNTVRLVRAALSAMCSDAADIDSGDAVLSRNPVAAAGGKRQRRLAVKLQKALRKKRVRTFTHRELAAFLKATKDQPLAYRALFHLLADQGCRPGEARRLPWSGVDLAAGRADVWATKTTSSRTIELTPRVARLLRVLKGGAKEGSTLVFTNAHGKIVDHSRLNKRMQRTLTLAGIAGPLSLYDFRHTFASFALQAGRSSTWVAEQMGDTVETVLRTYAHAVPPAPTKKSATRLQHGPRRQHAK